MDRIIAQQRSIIPACDVDIDAFEKLVSETAGSGHIGAYKLGFQLGLKYGLPRVVRLAREYTDKPLIYDHQKAGTDIPDTGKNFASICSQSGIDAVILFPQAGPETEKAWIQYALDAGLKVIVGGMMTHPGYLQSQGGYIADSAAMDMYLNAAKAGITDFVVPGNKPEMIAKIRSALLQEVDQPVFYAPGFISQGGELSDAAKAAGDSWHAIIGRALTGSSDIKKSLEELSGKL